MFYLLQQANGDDVEGFDKLEFKETQPSSSVAKMTLAQVNDAMVNSLGDRVIHIDFSIFYAAGLILNVVALALC